MKTPTSLESHKKAHYAKLAEDAITAGDHRMASFNLAKTGEYTLKLAEKCDGRIRTKYEAEAQELISLAEAFQSKAAAAASNPLSSASTQIHPSSKNNGNSPNPPAISPAARKSKNAVSDEDEGDSDWLVSEKPSIRLKDIAGMADVKTKLSEMIIQPIRNKEKARQWGVRAGGGILMYGPPGTGKTTLGKAVAGELEADFFYATGAEIRSKWHGESEQRLRKLIQAARACPVAVLFFDDVEGLLPKRGGNSVVDNRLVVQFLNEIGGFRESPNVLLVLGATNKPWDLDEAVFRTGRFDEKIFVGLPDAAAREFLVQRGLQGVAVMPTFDVKTAAEKFEGYTGSDIVAVVESAKRAGFRRSLEGGEDKLTLDDLEAAMKTIPSSATPAMMRDYEQFAKARFKS